MGEVSTAVETAKEREDRSPRAFVMRYSTELTSVMPTHLTSQGDAWLRVATGALKTGKIGANGMFELEHAALNNPAAFMQALRKAASLGLQPGTEQFYLTVRKVKGQPEILGIVGYQGYIELMYRAGYTDSVVVETVHANDEFEYNPGDERPTHKVNWRAERGALELVYAYAKMTSGATSRVIVLNADDIKKIKAKSQGADSEYSPWKTATNAMWLKSAVRQLQKWVPTSTEIRGPGGLPVVPNVPQVNQAQAQAALASATPVGRTELTDGRHLTDVDSDEVVEGSLIEDADGNTVDPEAEPISAEEEPPGPTVIPPEGEVHEAEVVEAPLPEVLDAGPPVKTTLSDAQYRTMTRLFTKISIEKLEDRLDFVANVLPDLPKIEELKVLAPFEANAVIEALNRVAKGEPAVAPA